MFKKRKKEIIKQINTSIKKIDESIKIMDMTTNDMLFINDKFQKIENKEDVMVILDLLNDLKLKYTSLLKKKRKKEYKPNYQMVLDYIETMNVKTLIVFDTFKIREN